MAFAIKRPHLSVVWLLKNGPHRLCRGRYCLSAASFASQQRNEIMKNNLRFVNRSAKFFSLRSALQNRSADHPSTRNPCRCCVCSAVCVARGRILREPAQAGKGFVIKISDFSGNADYGTSSARCRPPIYRIISPGPVPALPSPEDNHP